MPLFDLNFVDGKRAMYFDDKHNGKRMRTAIISDTRGSKIDGTVISKDQLKYVFNMVGIKNISSLVDPNDRQNVAAVLRLFEALGKSVKICEKVTSKFFVSYHSHLKPFTVSLMAFFVYSVIQK